MIIDKLEEMIVGSPTTMDLKKLHDTQQEIFWNNCFSHNVMFAYIVKKGFGLIMMPRHDRLPKGVPDKYMHKDVTNTKARSKIERYLQPIVMVKKDK